MLSHWRAHMQSSGALLLLLLSSSLSVTRVCGAPAAAPPGRNAAAAAAAPPSSPCVTPSAMEGGQKLHHVESTLSVKSSVSDWGPEEHQGDSGIKLPANAPLSPLAVAALRPTQLAVGMQQVQEKMKKLQKKAAKGPDALDKFLLSHPVPVVLGPGRQHYLIDHHHLTRAMHELGITKCYAGVVADYSTLTEEQFWAAMAQHKFLWPFTAGGQRLDAHQLPTMLPRTVAELPDDPYRSLAALVRKAGGYQKSTRPFSEFLWANYLRPRVPMALAASPDVASYVPQALSQAGHSDAQALPGFTPLQPVRPTSQQQQQQQQQQAPPAACAAVDAAKAAAFPAAGR